MDELPQLSPRYVTRIVKNERNISMHDQVQIVLSSSGSHRPVLSRNRSFGARFRCFWTRQNISLPLLSSFHLA